MAEILKNYGALIGPLLAFALGVIAIYIKFYVDREVESWKRRKKLFKLFQLIRESRPPGHFYPKVSETGFIHADQARNTETRYWHEPTCKHHRTTLEIFRTLINGL